MELAFFDAHPHAKVYDTSDGAFMAMLTCPKPRAPDQPCAHKYAHLFERNIDGQVIATVIRDAESMQSPSWLYIVDVDSCPGSLDFRAKFEETIVNDVHVAKALLADALPISSMVTIYQGQCIGFMVSQEGMMERQRLIRTCDLHWERAVPASANADDYQWLSPFHSGIHSMYAMPFFEMMEVVPTEVYKVKCVPHPKPGAPRFSQLEAQALLRQFPDAPGIGGVCLSDTFENCILCSIYDDAGKLPAWPMLGAWFSKLCPLPSLIPWKSYIPGTGNSAFFLGRRPAGQVCFVGTVLRQEVARTYTVAITHSERGILFNGNLISNFGVCVEMDKRLGNCDTGAEDLLLIDQVAVGHTRISFYIAPF